MRPEYVCTDPSHPPIISYSGRDSVYQQVRASVKTHERDGLSKEEIVRQVTAEILPHLSAPSGHWSDLLSVQQMRRTIADDWSEVFCKIDNLGFLIGWFINECAQEREAGELHNALCNLAFESNRNLFAVVNQLRSGLWQDAFGFLRTLHETLVKSRFLRKRTEEDSDLPGRFFYYTNATYLRLYREFASIYDDHRALGML